MGCIVRFLFVVFLSGLCWAEQFEGEELLSVMQTIVRGQREIQLRFMEQDDKQNAIRNSLRAIREVTLELNSNLRKVTDSIVALTETVQGSLMDMTDMIKDNKEDHQVSEGAVNDTKPLLEGGFDFILNLVKNMSSIDTSLNDTCTDVLRFDDDPTDIAKGKPTLPFRNWPTLPSEDAVDGNINSFYHSIDKERPWWSVDLMNTYLIKAIDILPQRNVPEWFRDVKVFIGNHRVTDGDFSAYYLVGKYAGPWDGGDRVVYNLTEEICGRYVAIQGFSGDNYLLLVDVKVMA